MNEKLTEEQLNQIKNRVEAEDFKGDKKQYKKLLEYIEKKDIEGWNEWRKKSKERQAKSEANTFLPLHLEGADLSLAHLEEADLIHTHLEGADLSYSHLEGAILAQVYLEGADLSYSHLEGADLIGIYVGKSDNSKKNETITNLDKTFFGNAILSIGDNCNEKEAIKALSKAEINDIRFLDPVFGRKLRDEAWLYHYKKQCPWFKKPLQFLWWITCDYGRNILLWAVWSLFLALFFASQFFCLGESAFKVGELGFSFETMAYYSVVTFTTLGFGDIVPVTAKASWWVMAEVVTGYVMLGGLISILANKLARRND